MIEKFHIGFDDIENQKFHRMKASEELKEALGINKHKNQKTVHEYFDEYLGDKKTKQYLQSEFHKSIENTLPKNVKESCLYCNKRSKDKNDMKCQSYQIEGDMNVFFAVWWFVNIVENNKLLLSEKKAIKELSIKLYECFLFKDGRVYFDLRKLTMYCLEQGFLTLSRIFAENDKILNLEVINKTIENLDSEYLSIKMFDKEEPYHIEPQKFFFESKRKSIKEQLKIERLKKKQSQHQTPATDNQNKVNINQHSHIFKDKAFEFWERLFENFNIDKTKRTDLRFMYEIMKNKGQIHQYVSVKNITDWINETYKFSIDKLQYTSIKSKSNENRMSIYNLIK